MNLTCVSRAIALQLSQSIRVVGHEYRDILGRLHLPLAFQDTEGDVVVLSIAAESIGSEGLTALCPN